MAFSSGASEGTLCDMNIIPLADVLLVLLIIFMVTAPTPSYPIDIDLPQRSLNPPPQTVDPPDPIRLRVDAAGDVFWNDNPTPVSALFNLMSAEIERDPANQPTLEIDVNDDADYGVVAKVLAEAKAANMQKIGFVKQ
jgi:biopolymer transport protein ExbD